MTDAKTPNTLSPEQISSALQAFQDAFKQARPLVMERAGKSEFTSKANDGSPVTATDVEVEDMVQAELAKRFPGMPVYGEEGGYEEDLSGAFWLIDPIDGTKSFIENVPSFTAMAVLIQNSEAVAAIIYNYSTQDMFVAQKGQGTYRNGKRVNLKEMPLPHTAYCKARFFDALDAILKPKEVTCENGPQGGGFGFTMVVEGKAAARFNLLGGGYIHDYAPGALLVREAGGAIIPIKEYAYTYETRSFVACHPELEQIIREHAAQIRDLEISLADK